MLSVNLSICFFFIVSTCLGSYIIYLQIRNNLSYLYNDNGLYLHVCGQLNAMMLADIIPAFTLTKH